MKGYEAIFIYRPSLNEEERTKLTEKIEKIISENGVLHETNYWGRRRTAYPLGKFTDGHFYLFIFDGEGKLPYELKRLTTITETILRSMVIARKTTYQKKEVPALEVKPPTPPVAPIVEDTPAIEIDSSVEEPAFEEIPILEEAIKIEENNA